MAAAVADPIRSPSALPPAARSHAFGLDLRAGFPVHGLSPSRGLGTRAQPTQLELADAGALHARNGGVEPVLLSHWQGEGGAWSLEHDERRGYRLSTELYGTFVVSPDGRRIECAPPAGGGHLWQHCLRGQALPLAAVLRGLETFHASAVAVDHRALAFVGSSSAGKTSVAMNLLLRGADLLTDDVLALDLRGGRPFAYPGVGVVSLRHVEAAALGRSPGSLGTVLEDDGEASRMLVPRYEGALPLSALYFLDRGGSGSIRFEPIDPPDPRLLLAASFNFVIRTPQRLRNQLDVCACLAAKVPQFRVRSGSAANAAAVARAVEAHAT
jgi:hypothetical protein